MADLFKSAVRRHHNLLHAEGVPPITGPINKGKGKSNTGGKGHGKGQGGGGGAWRPSDISNATIWLDAGQGVTQTGSRVDTWTDQIGGHVFDRVAQPQMSTLNGLPAIACVGTDASVSRSLICTTYSETGTALSAFRVGTITAGGASAGRLIAMGQAGLPGDGNQTKNFHLGGQSTSGGNVFAERAGWANMITTVGVDTAFVAGVTFDGVKADLIANGGAAVTDPTSTGNFGIDRVMLHQSNYTLEPCYGTTAEILITGGAISTDDRQKLEGYWAHRYGITLPSGHPYENDPPE